MATAGPGSGPVSLFGVSNKLQNKLNSFREVIEKKKLEVRRVSRKLRSLIEKKEEEIIRELDTLLEEVSTRMEKKKTETQKEIEEIKSKAKELETLLSKINQKSVQKIDIFESIETAKREMDIDVPNVKLTWRVDELKDCINRMCHCEQQILIYNEDTHYQLKWIECNKGRGDNQLYHPCGIATNPMNDDIYVADNGNDRVQIFSKGGEWIRFVKDDEMKFPENILFLNQSIFIQCSTAILKLNESTEKKEESISFDFDLGGACTDNIHLYVGKWKEMIIIVLTLNLIEENRISLKTEFSRQDTYIRDISLSLELFYILLLNTEYSIQIFSREGIMTRCVVKEDSINSASYFCLDQQQNILVADDGDSKVKIFSNEGKLLTQFGEKGFDRDQPQYFVGISVDDLGTIVTVDWNHSPILQIFSHL